MEAAEAAKAVGRCRVLRKYCYGMMAKLLHLHSSVLSAGGRARPQCLLSSDYNSKMKKKLESSFPDQPDVCRTPQFDNTAPQTLVQLQELYEVFDEVLELRDAMSSAIRDVSGCRSSVPPHFKVRLCIHLLYNPCVGIVHAPLGVYNRLQHTKHA
jgi:Membrane-associated apoptosis protein